MSNQLIDVLEEVMLTGEITVTELLDEPMDEEEVLEEIEQLISVKEENTIRYFHLVYVKTNDYAVGHVMEEEKEEDIQKLLDRQGTTVFRTHGTLKSKTTIKEHLTTIQTNETSERHFLLALSTKFPYDACYYTEQHQDNIHQLLDLK